jgi:hypothetical protein
MMKQIDMLRPAILNLQSEVFEDAGHALFVDEAERFNSVAKKFVATIPAK